MVKVNKNDCKGCGICVNFCPVKGLLKIDEDKVNAKGWNPVKCTEQEKCISCAICATMCPDVAIEVYKEVPSSEKEGENSLE